MSIADEQLSYEQHLNFYKRLGHISGDSDRDALWVRKSEHVHALTVIDAILDVHLGAAALGQAVDRSSASFQIRFGVSRRAKFIWLSLRGLLAQIPPDRVEPLLVDQVEESARDLNVIYINIRGVLDNLAWFLVEMFGDEDTRNLPAMKISLFGKEFLKDTNLAALTSVVEDFADWNRELSGKRDPAAHRIPLSVPPAIIDQETREEFDRISAAYNASFDDAISEVSRGGDALQQFAQTEALFGQFQRVGKFYPFFVHHPDDGLIRIYPTVPQDVGQLVKLSRRIFDFTKARMSA